MSRRAAFASQLTQEDGTPAPAPPPAASTPNQPPSSTNNTSKNSRTSNNSTRGKGKQSRTQARPPPAVKISSPAAKAKTSLETAANLQALAKAAADNAELNGDDEDEDGEGGSNTCFICAEPVQYWALGSCNHRTCHICAIRLRALYKKRECTFCKTECDSVIFSESDSKPFEEYDAEATPFSDTKLGILFETRVQLEDTLSLLRFNCPYRPNSLSTDSPTPPSSSESTPSSSGNDPCPQILTGWSDLKRHVRSSHHSTLCDLCCSNKKIFAHEHELFLIPATSIPGRNGNNNKGGRESELDVHLEKQHAMCGFCKRWFYDSDQLYKHCREMHEECFVCMRLGVRHQYHLNYDRLEQHFKDAHYLCPHPECLAQKFVVFESELDLQAHALSEHGVGSFGQGGTDQKSRKEARRIETNFVYSTGATERGGGNARGAAVGGRNGRNSNAAASFVDPPPRQALGERSVPGLGAGGATSSRNRGGFGGQLTTTSENNSGTSTPSNAGARGGGDSETLAQHAGLMKRVQDAVGGNEGRIAAFRFAVRSYRGNEMSAVDLVDQLFNIFDQRVDEAGSLIRGVAELFEELDKRQAVLQAWNDSRNEQNQFPSLAPLAPTLHGQPTSANPTSARALASQHRTQRPSTTWDRVEQAATSRGPAAIQPRSNPFPALMSASNAKNVVGLRNAGVQKKRVVGGSTPWSAAGSSGAQAPTTSSFPSLTPGSSSSSSSTTPPHLSRQPSPGSFPTLSGLSSSRPSVSPSSSSSKVVVSGSRKAPPPRASSGLDFPSLPTSSAASEARARMRAALQKPGMARTITDEGVTPPGERGEEAWAFGAGSNDAGGQGKKKGKGRQKVVLMSGGLAGGY
ncbi:E3 ubiquitin-protein ligase HEL2 [Sporobolomyces salmoneus]|uniref:E3 ubiquitin-protein ligase HEL2 n=1 Tax=Sporobolomyces salmoneus TaxID=183962 RepID=UPI00317B10D2